MSEADGERYMLEGARVYLHVTNVGGERIIHIDVEHDELNEILLPKEASYVGGREGGVYIGLRPPQQERAEAWVRARAADAR